MYALATQATGGERESHRAKSSVCAHHTPATGGEERDIEPIKWMRSHTSYRWRERESRANKCMRSTHQLQVERRESQEPNKCMRSPHTSYRWRGERVIEPIKLCARHTPATGGEERES